MQSFLFDPATTTFSPPDGGGFVDSHKSSYLSTSTSIHEDALLNGDYEILTTNYGWMNKTNPPGPSRRKLTAELFRTILTHPKYNASAWEDLSLRPDPKRRVVIFLDRDTCMERNYPNYGVDWTHDNINLDIHAQPGERIMRAFRINCQFIKRAAESLVLMANPHSRMVIFDCGTGHDGSRLKEFCEDNANSKLQQRLGGGWGKNVLTNDQVIITRYDIRKADARPESDIGLPAPAIKSVMSTPHERYWINRCDSSTKGTACSPFKGREGTGGIDWKPWTMDEMSTCG
ncbi:hypothetical protein ACHAWF_001458 [Thalassiosira exigua]